MFKNSFLVARFLCSSVVFWHDVSNVGSFSLFLCWKSLSFFHEFLISITLFSGLLEASTIPTLTTSDLPTSSPKIRRTTGARPRAAQTGKSPFWTSWDCPGKKIFRLFAFKKNREISPRCWTAATSWQSWPCPRSCSGCRCGQRSNLARPVQHMECKEAWKKDHCYIKFFGILIVWCLHWGGQCLTISSKRRGTVDQCTVILERVRDTPAPFQPLDRGRVQRRQQRQVRVEVVLLPQPGHDLDELFD